MGQRDLHHSVRAEVALKLQEITSDTTTVGEEIDMDEFESLEMVIQAGTLTDGTFDVLVEEALDDGTGSPGAFSAVADADLLGTEAGAQLVAADDDKTTKIGYLGQERFVRLSIVSTGTTSGGFLSAVGIKSHARHDVSQDSQKN